MHHNQNSGLGELLKLLVLQNHESSKDAKKQIFDSGKRTGFRSETEYTWFLYHRIGLVETVPAIYGSAMLAPLVKPAQALPVLCTGSLRGDIIMIQTSRFAASPRNLPIVSATS